MKFVQSVFFISFTGFTFISCSSVRHASKDASLHPIDAARRNKLNGVYCNQPIDDQLDKSYTVAYDINALSDVQLVKQFFLLDTNWNITADKIELFAVDNELRLGIFSQSKRIAVFTINGKFRKGYFKTKKERKTTFPPIPPFYYFNQHVRLLITVDQSSNLVVKRKGKKTGMVFFFGTGFKMDNEYRYAPYKSLLP